MTFDAFDTAWQVLIEAGLVAGPQLGARATWATDAERWDRTRAVRLERAYRHAEGFQTWLRTAFPALAKPPAGRLARWWGLDPDGGAAEREGLRHTRQRLEALIRAVTAFQEGWAVARQDALAWSEALRDQGQPGSARLSRDVAQVAQSLAVAQLLAVQVLPRLERWRATAG